MRLKYFFLKSIAGFTNDVFRLFYFFRFDNSSCDKSQIYNSPMIIENDILFTPSYVFDLNATHKRIELCNRILLLL